jgi:aldose 1-epimerase
MKVTQQFCFRHSSGRDVFLFTLRNTKGTEAVISNYGAIISAFKIKMNDDSVNDIVLGFDKMEDYTSKEYLENYPWFGAAVGRHGNRIKNAAFTIDGHQYQLSRNNGNNQLHGGFEGFDKKVWDVVAVGEEAVVFSYSSPDGEEGFPGNVKVTIKFILSDNDELSHEYLATTDQPTVVNLTHHSYFNLDNGERTVEDYELKINAVQILEQDTGLAPTGNYINVTGTKYDFRNGKMISKDWDYETGYDQSFVVKTKSPELIKAAEVFSPHSKLKLAILTTEPILHFYTGKGIPVVTNGKNGNLYGSYSALCLETQVHPNAVNIPHFPNTVLRPGETYFHKTVYKITQEEK